MKLLIKLILLSLFVTFSFGHMSAFANKGVGSGGGGDPCKNEIDKDRLAILNWITYGDAKNLDFSKALIPGWTFDSPLPAKSYKERMLSVLEPGRVVVTCFLDPSRISDPAAQKIVAAEGVSYKAVTIGNPPRPTTCINYEDEDQVSHIDCNYDLVMATSSLGNPDYITVHHEYGDRWC
jgi:hypothetical protein